MLAEKKREREREEGKNINNKTLASTAANTKLARRCLFWLDTLDCQLAQTNIA